MTTPERLMEVQREARVDRLHADGAAVAEATTLWLESGLTVRTVRSAKMRSTPALMDEVSAGLQFPS